MKLYLTLKKKWFDMILTDEKKEEYREIKMYWAERLMTGFPKTFGIDRFHPDFKNFTTVEFKNGYRKNSPTATFECLGIKIGMPNPRWYEGENKEVFIIMLGQRLSNEN